jgi:hypothetical protein
MMFFSVGKDAINAPCFCKSRKVYLTDVALALGAKVFVALQGLVKKSLLVRHCAVSNCK